MGYYQAWVSYNRQGQRIRLYGQDPNGRSTDGIQGTFAPMSCESTQNTMTELYAEYSPSQLLSAGTVVYEDPETKLIRTATGLNLVTVLESAPSWSTSTPHPIPYLRSPDRLEWYSQLDAWAVKMFDFDRPSFSIAHVLRSISLFGKLRELSKFIYIGTGNLTSCGPAPKCFDSKCVFNLSYHIALTVRRDVWELLGGYRRWMISVGGRDFTPNCVEDAAKLIQETWGTGDFLLITRYEGDEFRASINDKGQAIVSYSASPTADILFSGRYTVADELGEWACFPLESGDNGWESPVSTIIDRNEALSIIGTYLATGWPSGLRRAE